MFSLRFLDDFDCSSSKNIYSTFYVEVNGIAFPDDQWTDFPFAVLRMWCGNLIINVIKKQSSEFQLYFMDGDFLIECQKKQEEIKMQFIGNRKVEHEITINPNKLVASIYQASRQLIDLVEQHDFGQIRDVEKLKLLIKKIKRLRVELFD